jgi:hypothetical protein
MASRSRCHGSQYPGFEGAIWSLVAGPVFFPMAAATKEQEVRSVGVVLKVLTVRRPEARYCCISKLGDMPGNVPCTLTFLVL